MIYGIGTDFCDIRRIDAALQRHGERFAEKILAEGELALFRQRKARSPGREVKFLATRFAAKEAFSKAIGLGMRMPMTWRRCEVVKAPSGAIALRLHGELREWFEAKGLQAHVTVTDEQDMAAAFVVVECVASSTTLRPEPVVGPSKATS
jgi:holo-[acyl-carrier protein] synthase